MHYFYLLIVFLSSISSIHSLEPFVWPLPQYYTVSSKPILAVSSSFAFSTLSSSSIVQYNINRYKEIIFDHVPEVTIVDNSTYILTGLTINISNNAENNLQYDVDESYNLTVPLSSKSIGILTANTIWGALRGLETFSQLVIYNFTLGYYVSYNYNIYDFPRFSHRGILIDTSRHFQPVQTIKTLLDAMSYNKFNVLHWHVVDAEAFPYESKLYPNLWNGAYSNYEKYSVNDAIAIINYAKNRGIRVIIEFDCPGHDGSWCIGYPNICPNPACVQEERETNVNNIPINPATNDTYNLINGLLSEVTSIFFDNYIHLGGDETDYYCWYQTPSIVQWMDDNGFDGDGAYEYFILNTHAIAKSYNRKVINWVEVYEIFGTSLPLDTIVQVWKDKTTLQQVVASGYNAILSDDDLWYLNELDITWEQMYLNEPYENINNIKEQLLIMGGEVCMWGEYVDSSDFENTIWPRSSAVAERLWSNRSVNNVNNALPRLEYFRCLLNQRGIAAAPTNNAIAREPPSQPGSCYQQ